MAQACRTTSWACPGQKKPEIRNVFLLFLLISFTFLDFNFFFYDKALHKSKPTATIWKESKSPCCIPLLLILPLLSCFWSLLGISKIQACSAISRFSVSGTGYRLSRMEDGGLELFICTTCPTHFPSSDSHLIKSALRVSLSWPLILFIAEVKVCAFSFWLSSVNCVLVVYVLFHSFALF